MTCNRCRHADEARPRTSDWRYAHVGELLWGFFMVACHLNPRSIFASGTMIGKLVGYAILGEDPSFDCQVLPEYEWSGIETEAMAWAEAALTELREHDAQRWGGHSRFRRPAGQRADALRFWSSTGSGTAASSPR